jgi:hypothetical protein
VDLPFSSTELVQHLAKPLNVAGIDKEHENVPHPPLASTVSAVEDFCLEGVQLGAEVCTQAFAGCVSVLSLGAKQRNISPAPDGSRQHRLKEGLGKNLDHGMESVLGWAIHGRSPFEGREV